MQARSAREKLARRACDACKLRKVRCSEVAPCTNCTASRVQCTFNTTRSTRGPRGLRAKTIAKIDRAQGHPDRCPSSDTPTDDTVPLLDIYAARLYPIWPIVDVAQLKEALQVPGDICSRRLAESIARATIAQLNLNIKWSSPSISPLELDSNENNLFANLRIAFFSHVYHENQEGGGHLSLLHLRNAITHAQILRLEHESTYGSLAEAEQQMFRRVLWLLFVTERGVALLHRLPVILKPNIAFPWYGVADNASNVLPDFLRLVQLFWIFDQSGMFDILRDDQSASSTSLAQNCLHSLQEKLQAAADASTDFPGNEIQRADILITRQWMRAVLWRSARRFGIAIPSISPVEIGREFLHLVSRIPTNVLESHGPTLEYKTFEIALTVIDSSEPNCDLSSSEVLHGLRRILSSSRGGNAKLLSLLASKQGVASPGSIPQLLNDPPEEQMRNYDQDGQITVYAGSYFGWDETMTQDRWSLLSFPYQMRSPSPLSRLLMDMNTGDMAGL